MVRGIRNSKENIFSSPALQRFAEQNYLNYLSNQEYQPPMNYRGTRDEVELIGNNNRFNLVDLKNKFIDAINNSQIDNTKNYENYENYLDETGDGYNTDDTDDSGIISIDIPEGAKSFSWTPETGVVVGPNEEALYNREALDPELDRLATPGSQYNAGIDIYPYNLESESTKIEREEDYYDEFPEEDPYFDEDSDIYSTYKDLKNLDEEAIKNIEKAERSGWLNYLRESDRIDELIIKEKDLKKEKGLKDSEIIGRLEQLAKMKQVLEEEAIKNFKAGARMGLWNEREIRKGVHAAKGYIYTDKYDKK